MKANKTKVETYVHHRNLLVRGQMETGVYYALFLLSMVSGMYLRTVVGLSEDNAGIFAGLVFVLLGASQYWLGRLCDLLGLIEADYDWVATRTPLLREVLSSLRKIEKRLEKIEVEINGRNSN